jgi:hypothetical protein
MAQLDAWRRAILGSWDASSWSGTGYDYGFDTEKSKVLSGLNRDNEKNIRKYYDELKKEIDF